MIIISPYSKAMRNGAKNPKNYPYWQDLIDALLLDNSLLQVGVKGDEKFNRIDFAALSIEELAELTCHRNYNHLVLCVDNFMHHMCHYYKKQCIVLWGQSDPELFGYKENINLLKDRKYLRPNQFDTWENAKFNSDAFMSAQEVFNNIKHLL